MTVVTTACVLAVEVMVAPGPLEEVMEEPEPPTDEVEAPDPGDEVVEEPKSGADVVEAPEPGDEVVDTLPPREDDTDWDELCWLVEVVV